MSEEKTHKPTAKKLQDARKRGEVPKSNDVPPALVFLAVVGTLYALSDFFVGRLQQLFKHFELSVKDPQLLGRWQLHLERAVTEWLVIVLPVLAAGLIAAVVAGLGQTRGLVSFELLKIKFEKLNPVENLKNMVSAKQFFDLLVKVLKITLLVAVIVRVLKDLVPALARSSYLPPQVLGSMMWHALFTMFGMACGVYLLIAAVDYGVQYFQFMKQQRMSFDDLKREYKDAEGDPHVKGQRRQMAAEMLEEAGQPRMAGSKVLVTNPTHFAVALGYEPGRMDVPCVLDKGSDEGALKLRQQARELGIPIFENVRLARDLYFSVPVGELIHDRMFEPVAEVLAWVARLDKSRAARTRP
jgi:type III secretion protein U